MAYITLSQLLAYPTGLWESIIAWFGTFITNYGWTIIVFTICLKVVLLPLDVFQKILTKKSSEKQAILQPKIEKLKEQYGNNKDLLNQKTIEMYKSENYNVMGSCFGMLINLVLTFVIFLTLFTGLRNISQYKISEQYTNLRAEYIATYDLEMEGLAQTEENKSAAHLLAQQSALDKYTQIKDSWLWISNVWISDTSASKYPTFESYRALSNKNYNTPLVLTEQEKLDLGVASDATVYYVTIEGQAILTSADALVSAKVDYDLVSTNILVTYSGWNGFYILIILAAVVTWLSQYILKKSMPQPKPTVLKDGTVVKSPSTTKIMEYILPVIMVLFTLSTSSAFAIYVVTNSVLSTISAYGITKIITFVEKKKALKNTTSVSYSRENIDKYTIQPSTKIKEGKTTVVQKTSSKKSNTKNKKQKEIIKSTKK